VQVTRTALVSVSSEPKHSQCASKHSLAQRHRALRPLWRPLPRHLGLPLLSLRRAVRHVRLRHPPPLWAWTWASIRTAVRASAGLRRRRRRRHGP
jgi:hypothetical protein